MSVINRIAFFQNRRDEVPNQELARELAQTRNAADVREVAGNLTNRESNIQSDCLKVLYELGYIAPELIAGYAGDFIKLLSHRNNRMVWGGMIALSTIASLRADEIFPHAEEIKKVMEAGTVITNDAGMRTLSAVAAQKDPYRLQLLPYLFKRLAAARPVDAPRYAGFILPAVGPSDKAEFIQIVEKWIATASGARLSRLKQIRRQAGDIS